MQNINLTHILINLTIGSKQNALAADKFAPRPHVCVCPLSGKHNVDVNHNSYVKSEGERVLIRDF